MTPAKYRDVLEALGLTQLAAGRWLGVSKRTAQKFAADGPSPPAARAIQMRLDLMALDRHRGVEDTSAAGDWILRPDMIHVIETDHPSQA